MFHLDPNQTENMNELFEAIVALQNVDECRDFFRDLCTMQELIALSRRLQVAKRLLDGETYEMIRRELPVSSATITRINAALQYGSGGYSAALYRKSEGKDAEE